MVRTNPVTPARENDGGDYGRDIDDLNEREQGVVSN